MYPVSEAFLTAVQENTRSFYWTGRITTKAGAVYEFGNGDIVKGSGYITSQCCGSAEIEIGTVYAAEMGLTLFSEIDRYTLEDGKIELFYHLLLGNGTEETVPMGIFEISEANRTIRCLEIKAYDYMLRFEKSFNGFETVGNAYAFLALCCKACKVELAHTQAEIEAILDNADYLVMRTEFSRRKGNLEMERERLCHTMEEQRRKPQGTAIQKSLKKCLSAKKLDRAMVECFLEKVRVYENRRMEASLFSYEEILRRMEG